MMHSFHNHIHTEAEKKHSLKNYCSGHYIVSHFYVAVYLLEVWADELNYVFGFLTLLQSVLMFM